MNAHKLLTLQMNTDNELNGTVYKYTGKPNDRQLNEETNKDVIKAKLNESTWNKHTGMKR